MAALYFFASRGKANLYGKSNRHRSTLILPVILALTVLFGGILPTTAFYKKTLGEVINIFSFQSAKVEISEPGVNPDDVSWGTDTKPVYVSIPSDGVKSIARVTVVPVVTDASGEVQRRLLGKLSEPDAENKIILGDITLVLDENWMSYWEYRGGLFYYKSVLVPGETSEKLLSGVVLTDDTAAKRSQYAGLKVNIEVISEALQSAGSAPSEWGASVDDSGNVNFS